MRLGPESNRHAARDPSEDFMPYASTNFTKVSIWYDADALIQS